MKSALRGMAARVGIVVACATPLSAAAAGVPYSQLANAERAGLRTVLDADADAQRPSFLGSSDRVQQCVATVDCLDTGFIQLLDIAAEEAPIVSNGEFAPVDTGSSGKSTDRLVMAANFLDPYMTRLTADPELTIAAVELRALSPVIMAEGSMQSSGRTLRYRPIDFLNMLITNYKLELSLAAIVLFGLIAVTTIRGSR